MNVPVPEVLLRRDPDAQEVAVAVNVERFAEVVLIGIEGQCPIGLNEQCALVLATRLMDAVQQIRDRRKKQGPPQ